MALISIIAFFALYFLISKKVMDSRFMQILFGIFGGAMIGSGIGNMIGFGEIPGGIIGALLVIGCIWFLFTSNKE